MSDQTFTNDLNGSPENTPAELPQIPLPIQVENIFRECEARLRILRSDVEQLTNSATTGQPISVSDQARMQQVIDLMSRLAKDPFALIKQGVRDAQSSAQESQPPVESAPANPDGSTPKPTDAEEPKATAPFSPNLTSMDREAQTLEIDAQNFTPESIAPVAASQQDSPATDLSSPAFGFAESGDASAFAGAQAAQASGERLRVALEQNTQATSSLFDEMLALLDGQNRKLGEVDRKISELNGQLNSLKNP